MRKDSQVAVFVALWAHPMPSRGWTALPKRSQDGGRRLKESCRRISALRCPQLGSHPLRGNLDYTSEACYDVLICDPICFSGEPGNTCFGSVFANSQGTKTFIGTGLIRYFLRVNVW